MVEKNEIIIEQLRNREYMTGIVRSKTRTNKTDEFFTPSSVVQEMLLDGDTDDITKNVCDASCGDGQFLVEVLARRLEAGYSHKDSLKTIFGIEFELDNVLLCRERLLCGRKDLTHIVEKNIVCADTITYNYSFGEPVGIANFF